MPKYFFRLLALALVLVIGNVGFLAFGVADEYGRDDFPAEFVFGSGTSAYQVEGAALEDGRSFSIWDAYAHSGIQPHVTLNHIDLPLILEDEYGGWLSRKSVKILLHLLMYASGNLVIGFCIGLPLMKPIYIYALGGYDTGSSPPGRCSSPFGYINCSRGDSTHEPYLVAYHFLLAHASTVRLYREKYKAMQHGSVGINLLAFWFEPYTNTIQDVKATQSANDFYLGWFLNPLVKGDYPETVKKSAGNRIPTFTKLESQKIKGSFDFLGINHYTTLYIKDNPNDLETDIYQGRLCRHGAYMNLKIYSGIEFPITEFPVIPIGQVQARNGTLMDTPRVEYLHAYIGAVLSALRNGSNTKGYFVWSFFDLLEMVGGYNYGYGLYYVDLDDKELTRYPKLSAHWYANFLKGNNINVIIPKVKLKDSFSN
ncbi:hypothetical protein Lser_V15G41576 [Lactuca serriola]